jgi:ferredoxin
MINQVQKDIPTSDVPTKYCRDCKKYLPATTEYFNQSHLAGGSRYNLCRKCHTTRSHLYRKIRRNKLIDIAQEIQQDAISSYQTLHMIAKCLGCPVTAVESDVLKRNLQVFKFMYRSSTALSLRLDDAQSYIASKGENEESNTSQDVPNKRISVGTPDQCGSCGTKTGNIIGDVEETGGQKYGYLCMKCYRIVREARRDSTRLRNVLSYVERVRKVM